MTKPGTSLPVRLANFVGAVFLRHDLSLIRTDILACLVIGEAAAGLALVVSTVWDFCAYRVLVFSAENPSREPALSASGA